MRTTRVWMILLGIGMAFGAILVRLGHLQIARAEEFRLKAIHRSLRLKILKPHRGRILARSASGLVALAEDRPSHDIAVILSRFDPTYILVRRLMQRPDVDSALLEERYRAIVELARSMGEGEFVLYPGLGAKARDSVRHSLRACGEARTVEREGDATYDLIISAAAILQADRTLESISSIVGLDPTEKLEHTRRMILRSLAVKNTYQREHELRSPRPLEREVSFEQALRVEKRHEEFPGIRVVESVRRAYPLGEAAGHLLGYLAGINPQEKDSLTVENKLVDLWRSLREIDSIHRRRDGAHFQDDRVGREGLELALEEQLTGAVGAELVERDAKGTITKRIDRLKPRHGSDLIVTIRPSVQTVAADALKEAVESNEPSTGGAVVVVDVQTGGILALVSYPSYDPTRFRKDYSRLSADPRHPLFHRAIRENYAPGSVFKAVTAIAALEAGVLSPDERLTCAGALRPGGSTFRCHYRAGHGPLDLREALQKSCNVFFYKLGERLGGQRLHDWAARFGLGAPTGIEIPWEGKGLVPSPGWLRQFSRGKIPWTKGLNRNFAIGQGDLQVTPIQIAGLMAAIARDGSPLSLSLLEEASTTESALPPAHRPIRRAHLDLVREGLRWVVQRPGGTANRIEGLREVKAAGKTGTAQAGAQRNHAWFAGYAPSDRPRVAVAVVVERVKDGAHGGAVAGPVAAAVLKAALETE